jgi:PIN domain nuclease of toxin-antitoxin system
MILLDTCAIVWDALARERLSSNAKDAIDAAAASHTLLIADISLWEIAILISKGRLQIDASPEHFMKLYLQARAVVVVPISPQIAQLSATLDESIGADPADRLIAASTLASRASLVTGDSKLLASKQIPTVW